MASIRSMIELVDKVSQPLKNIKGNLSVTVTGFEDGQQAVSRFSRSFDDSRITAGVRSVNNEVARMPGKFNQAAIAADHLQRSGSSMFRTLMGLGAVRGVVNMVRNQMSSAVERMDTMSNFNRTMTAVTGDSKAAKQALGELKDMTKGTAYGLNNAAAAVQNFTTRGMNIKNATAEVGYWADAVAFYGDGTNESLHTVTDALGKMMTKRKVEMEQLDRLTYVGIPAVNMYAKATGRAAAAVQEDLSDGAISAQDFITTVSTAFESGTNGVLNIAGAAKRAGNTWATIISNMKIAVTRGLESAINGINGALEKAGLGTIQEGIKRFGEAAENALGKVGAVFGTAITFFARHREQILITTQILSSLAVAYMIVSGAIGIVTTVMTICQTVMALFGVSSMIGFGLAIVAIGAVAGGIFSLIEWIKDLNKKTGDSGETMELVFKKIEVKVAQLSAVWAGFTGSLQITWNTACLGVEIAFRTVFGVILGIIWLIGDAVRSMVNGAIGLINEMIRSLNTLPGVSIDVIKEVSWSGIDDIGNMAKNQFNAIYDATMKTDEKNKKIADEMTAKDDAAAKAQREYDALYKKYTTNNGKGKDKGKVKTPKVPELNGIGNNTKKTAANTANIAKQLSITSEQLKYIRDYATSKAVNRYTAATIKVTMNNKNKISKDMDLDGVVDHLKTKLEEKMSAAAEGVHI